MKPLKRGSTADLPPAKRAKTLTSYLAVPAGLKVPAVIASSEQIEDRESQFIAHAASVSSPAQADIFKRHIVEAHSADPASHEMLAYRIVATKPGKDGQAEDDWQIKSAMDDDGEKYGASKILQVLEDEGAMDVCVIVSRWYGGVMLGRARFDHIANTTREALCKLRAADELASNVKALQSYDDQISDLCRQIGPSASPGKVPEYSKLAQDTAKRLLTARKQRIKHLQGVLDRSREMPREDSLGPGEPNLKNAAPSPKE